MRGDVEFPQRALEDFICVKGNGKALFVLANAVDDRTMAITHVIRGEDQLPTTPRQIMLWGALNAAEGIDLALPAYAHLPLLVNEQGKKLSKRRDPVAVEMYREQGYLPEAFRNYLALLGWSPGDEEILPLETIIERFRLEDVQRSPAFFDVKKLTHMNGVYIRELRPRASSTRCGPWVDPAAGTVGAGSLARSGHGGPGDRATDLGGRSLRRQHLRPPGASRPGTGHRAGRGPRAGRLPLLGRGARRSRELAEGRGRRRRGAAAFCPRRWRPTRPARGTSTRCTRPRWPSRRGWAASWARPRRRSGWPSWGERGAAPLRLAGRARPGRDATPPGRRRSNGWPPST